MNQDANRLHSDDARWHRVLTRDATADGAFVYAVSTTGVYCRPSCPSRRPRRANVAYFPIPEAAEGAGFRACRRCRPQVARAVDPKLAAVRRACAFIEGETERKPTLADVAASVGLSPHHLQRVFTAVMGISPRAYAEALRFGRFRGALKAGEAVTPALYGAGFGSSLRLYEYAARRLGMTPATYAKGGKGADISYALAPSPLGRLLVAATQVGVCMVSLGSRDSDIVAALKTEFPDAKIARDEGDLADEIGAVVAHLEGREPHIDLPLDVRATAFQWRVWGSLRTIPPGETRSYAELARAIGRLQAARAVGRACATNPVSLIVPCHRAVGADGKLTGYRWGVERKKALLEVERARANPPARRAGTRAP
ncbi:MAG: bifunctional DNA-binding transcriptional regulator/O6-methylguanine-DNA methyltransferase Ada [Rhodospirillales bacterium]|jgi:AraC family transcriptional regulator of adaptative response/methylated-DNA-[protein]-cysteine methyltransferase|nr:bifunctional DNA-binding transcriptional regulator/O6-methylguanine-DNA methyltransferase Ada [Rhodospirillales bacterium]